MKEKKISMLPIVNQSIVNQYNDILEQAMFGGKAPAFPKEGTIQGKVVRWLRSVLWSIWDIFVPGSYAREVYERVHELALRAFEKEHVVNPEETWRSTSALVALANLSKQTSYAWQIIALSVHQMSSVAWVVDRAQYRHLDHTVLSHTMRRLVKSPQGHSLLNKPLFIEVLHLIVPSEEEWPYVKDAEPFSSQAARSSFWQYLFDENCPSGTWEDFDNQLIARMSQNVELLSGIIRDLPNVDFEWLCLQLFRPIHQHLAASPEFDLPGSVRASENWMGVTEHRINWLALADRLEPGLSQELQELNPSLQALALAIYFSVGRDRCKDRQAWIFVTTLVASSKGWNHDPELLFSLMDHLKDRDLDSHAIEVLWQEIAGQEMEACGVSGAKLAYDLADLFFIDKRIQEVLGSGFKENEGWSDFLEMPFILSCMREAREKGESPRLPIKVEGWLLLISLYNKHKDPTQPLTRAGFYEFAVGRRFDLEQTQVEEGKFWADRLLADVLQSLDGDLQAAGSNLSSSQLFRLKAWGLLVEMGLFKGRAKELIQNRGVATISLSDFEHSFVASSMDSNVSFEENWPSFHPDTCLRFLKEVCTLGTTPQEEGAAHAIKEAILDYCQGNQVQAEAALKYVNGLGIFPFRLISDVFYNKLALAKEQSPRPILSAQSAYTFDFSLVGNGSVGLFISIQPSLEVPMRGYVRYEVDISGKVKASDFSCILS